MTSGRFPVHVPPAVFTTVGVLVLAALALHVAGVPFVRHAWPGRGALALAHPGPIDTRATAAEDRLRRAARVVAAAKDAGEASRDRGGTVEDTALLGAEIGPFVTTLGSLEAKRVAARPGWARVLTTELASRGVGPGAVIAATFSGSFPALNLAVICAAHELGARVVAVSSVTASTWGATDPGFTWPEIETRLVREGIIRPASAGLSVGGDSDRGLDLDPEARVAARATAEQASRALGARMLIPQSHAQAVAMRLEVFEQGRAGQPLAAFVNVGGTEAALGRSPAILRVRSGWLLTLPSGLAPDDGVVAAMAARGVPVLHMLNVRELALTWGVE